MENETNWKNKIIRFLTAQTISLFGSSLVQFAIIWYITLSTTSGKMLTISTICGFLPQIVISLFAGVWIDRYNRKNMIMLADCAIAISTLTVAILFLTGHNNIWLLFTVLLVRSAGTGIQTPAVNAILPQIVPKEHLMKVDGIFSTIISMIMFLSPAVSGAILTFATIETTFLIDVVTAIIGVGLTYFIAIKPHEPNVCESCIQDIKNGFTYLRENPFLKKLLIFQLLVIILVSPAAFLTPLMVARTFGTEFWRLSASEMTFSLGAALGGILIAVWGGFKNRMHTTILAGLFYGIMMIALGLSPLFWIYLFFNTLIGIAFPCYNSPITVMIQEKVEPSMQGRVFSFVQITNSCALPLGMVLFGPLADIVSVQSILIFAGIAVAGITLGYLLDL